MNKDGIKHSFLGIASFLMAIVAAMIIWVYIAAVLLLRKYPLIVQSYAANDPLVTCLAAGLALLGLGLGIAAVVKKETKRAFGILGLVLNGLFLLGTCSLLAVNVFTLMRAGGQ